MAGPNPILDKSFLDKTDALNGDIYVALVPDPVSAPSYQLSTDENNLRLAAEKLFKQATGKIRFEEIGYGLKKENGRYTEGRTLYIKQRSIAGTIDQLKKEYSTFFLQNETSFPLTENTHVPLQVRIELYAEDQIGPNAHIDTTLSEDFVNKNIVMVKELNDYKIESRITPPAVPVRGGTAVTRPGVKGTLGAWINRETSNGLQKAMLTCRHVAGAEGTELVAGGVNRFISVAAGEKEKWFDDFALARPADEKLNPVPADNAAVIDHPITPFHGINKISIPLAGKKVFKTGCTSGYTHGIITSIYLVPDQPDGNKRKMIFCFDVQGGSDLGDPKVFGGSGDSGAIVVGMDHTAMGMFMAGKGNNSQYNDTVVCLEMTYLFDQLNLKEIKK